MTTVEITLPDQLAQEARQAALLSPDMFEQWLREQLRSRRVAELFSAMERMSASNAVPEMSPEEVAEEIKAMRAERRAAA